MRASSGLETLILLTAMLGSAVVQADDEAIGALNATGLAVDPAGPAPAPEAAPEPASEPVPGAEGEPAAAEPPALADQAVDLALSFAPEIGGPVGAVMRQVEQGQALYRGLAADYDQARALVELFARENPAQALELQILGGAEAGAFGDPGAGAAGRLSVAGRVTVHGRQCRIAELGGQLGVGGEEIVSVIQWLDLCPWNGLPFPVGYEDLVVRAFPLRFHERVLWRVTPTLGAPLLVDRGRFTTAGLGFDVVGMEMDYAGGGKRLGFIGFSDEISWLVETNGDGERLFFARSDIWIVRWQKLRRDPAALGDAVMDFLVIGIESIKAKNGTAVIELQPVRVRGFGLGPVLLDLEGGIVGTGTSSTTISCNHPLCGDDPFFEETVETDGLPDVDFGFLRGGLRLGTPRRHGAVGAGRWLRPTLGAELVLEDRVWGTLALAGGGVTVDLDVHAARHRFWLDETTEGEDTTWGGAAAMSHRLPRDLRIGVRVEAGRSFFADADAGDTAPGALPRASFGWRGLVTLSVGRAVIRSL